jgi:citrate lyase subunit beta/citryl-CoA lyase
MTQRLANARTLLFAPGHRPERFVKAVNCGPDVLILDLEDGVPWHEKDAARAAIEHQWTRLQDYALPVVVRINSPQSPAHERDLEWLSRLSTPPHAVVVPKAECGEVLAHVHRYANGVALLPLIETAKGYAALSSVAAAPGVVRLVIGHIDFMTDVGLDCGEGQFELAPLRFAVAIASRVHNLAPAVDSVTVEISDEAKLRDDVRRALAFGFGGKLCIHPRQVGVVHQAMLPTDEQVRWAHKVLAADAAAAGDAVQVEGTMVDLPVVLRARRTLARAASLD